MHIFAAYLYWKIILIFYYFLSISFELFVCFSLSRTWFWLWIDEKGEELFHTTLYKHRHWVNLADRLLPTKQKIKTNEEILACVVLDQA